MCLYPSHISPIPSLCKPLPPTQPGIHGYLSVHVVEFLQLLLQLDGLVLRQVGHCFCNKTPHITQCRLLQQNITLHSVVCYKTPSHYTVSSARTQHHITQCRLPQHNITLHSVVSYNTPSHYTVSSPTTHHHITQCCLLQYTITLHSVICYNTPSHYTVSSATKHHHITQ